MTSIVALPSSLSVSQWLASRLQPDIPALLLVPTRRAAVYLSRQIKQDFPRLRLCPLGELETVLRNLGRPIPPALPAPERLTRLAQFLWQEKQVLDLPLRSFEQAIRLGQQAIAAMDELDREQIPYEQALNLSPTPFAEHWQRHLRVLHAVLRHWPQQLQAMGRLQPIARRNAILAAVAAQWQREPPDYPVIAAGSTGSQKATAALLRVVATLPHGTVLLPGLEACDTQLWTAIEPSHPYFFMKRWLEGDPPAASASADLSRLFAPAACAQWDAAPKPEWDFTRIDCAHPREEAALIARLLTNSTSRAAVITPDTALLRRVAWHLNAQAVAYDNAVGATALNLPAMRFLNLTLDMLSQPQSALPCLALLKHPWVAPPWIAAFERDWLRAQPRQDTGIGALLRWAQTPECPHREAIETLLGRLQPVLARFTQRRAQAVELWDAQWELAAGLAGDNWPQDEELLDIRAALHASLAHAGEIDAAHYAGLWRESAQALRLADTPDAEARVALLTPMEARLLTFDRVILAGLNEGSWPQSGSNHSWFNAAMRAQIGLPDATSRIGQEAHDLLCALGSGREIIMTRSRYAEGQETLPSRWLERLDALTGAASHAIHPELAALRAQQAVAMRPTPPPPAPCPPPDARPTRLAVTQMELLLRNPYGFYARHILKLAPLQSLEQSPDAALRGTLIHRLMERFVARVNNDAAACTEAVFMDCARDVLRELSDWPVVTLFWLPRLARLAPELVALERERRRHCHSIKPEYQAQAPIGLLTLTARIDRLEIDHAGAAHIVDYKTGQAPPKNEIEEGYACQLPLSGLLLQAQGLRPESLAYWPLGRGLDKDAAAPLALDIPALSAFYRDGIARLSAAYLTHHQPYLATPVAARAPAFNDYAQLAREQEWREG